MTDKEKLKLIGEMIDCFYEGYPGQNDKKLAAAGEMTIGFIERILDFNGTEDSCGHTCKCSGECHNCVEQTEGKMGHYIFLICVTFMVAATLYFNGRRPRF